MAIDQKDESKTTIITQTSTGQLIHVGVEQIKNTYIVEGSSPAELAAKFNLPIGTIKKIIEENKLDAVRAAHIKHGLAQLQNMQLVQAEKLMNIETQFKRMRIIQLEKSLEDYMAYYSKYGHFYKVHPNTGEILKDTNNMPMQIKLPNVSHEIMQLKEAVSMSEGLKHLLGQIDDIINKPKDTENLNSDVIDVTQYNNLFKKKSHGDDD